MPALPMPRAGSDESVHLEPSLEHAVSNAHKAALNRVDFKTDHKEVRTRVNSWVKKETNGLIKDAISRGSVNTQTRLLFANALYFKGNWDEEFDARKTKKYDFQTLDGSLVKRVPYMTSRERQCVSEFDGFKVLKLLYRQGKDTRRYSMCLFLPEAKVDYRLWLTDLIPIEPGFLDDRYIPSVPERVGDLRIPKFKFSFGFEACNVVKELGLLRGLTEEVKSLVGDPLFLPSIFHKAVIEVTEKGTEAAAVTVGHGLKSGAPGRPIDFVADHPFMFVIREDVTRTVLFIGCVLNPLKG